MATKRELQAIAREYGCASLLGVDTNSKTVKGQKRQYLTGILYMMPDDKLCPMASKAGCREACLVSAGRGVMSNVQKARKGRVDFFRDNREAFMMLLIKEIEGLKRKAQRKGMRVAVRLNGTSDINWSTITYQGKSVFEHFRDVQFYDYTKSPSILRAAAGEPNWSVVGSYSETSWQYSMLIKAAADKYGANLAVVFRDRDSIPATFLGRPVVDGDADDLRFLDPKGSIVALVAKGDAKQDTTGFVVDNEPRVIAAA